jgi:hypothetical protein
MAVRAHGSAAAGLGDRDFVLGVGEAAEFDTQLPHWFGSTGQGSAEILSIFGRPGERIHLRATPQPDGDGRQAVRATPTRHRTT